MTDTTKDSASIVKKAPNKLETLRDYLSQNIGAIQAVLPKHMNPEKMLKLAVSAASRTPDLLVCTNRSIISSLIESATLGLEPNTSLQHAFLIPFRNRALEKQRNSKTAIYECTLVTGYRGLCQLAWNSGQIALVYADVICEGDEYDEERGTNKRLFHKTPRLGSGVQRGAELGYYAVLKFRSGEYDHVLLDVDEVESIRQRFSGAPDSPAWKNSFAAMGMKSCVRRLLRMAPMSPDRPLGQALALEESNDEMGRSGRRLASAVYDALPPDPQTDPETGEVTGEAAALPEPASRAEGLASKLKQSLDAPVGAPVRREGES